jgi:uncharacterized protein YciI
MAWLVIAEDSDEGPAIRADGAAMGRMWDYELANRETIVAAGSLREDDRETKNGSLFILNLETRAEAEAFLAADPAMTDGLRGKITLRWLNLAILDGAIQE